MHEKYLLDELSITIFEEISNKFKNKKVVFLYDELYRCTEKYIKEFFSNIKLIFQFDNFVHIFFANKNVINNVFSTLNIDNEEYFLEKFLTFQYPIQEDPILFLITLINKFLPSTNYQDIFDSYNKLNGKIKIYLNNITFREIRKQEQNIKIFLDLIDSSLRILYNINMKKI